MTYHFKGAEESGNVSLDLKSLARFPVNQSLVGKPIRSLTMCFRFVLTIVTSAGVVEDFAGLSVMMYNPTEGYGYVKGVCGKKTFWFLFYMSDRPIPVMTVKHICISVENRQTSLSNRTTRIKVVQGGRLWSDTKFKGQRALACPLTTRPNFYLGGSSEGSGLRLKYYYGLFSDLNIWSRALDDEEMIMFTKSFRDGQQINTTDKFLDWKQYNHEDVQLGSQINTFHARSDSEGQGQIWYVEIAKELEYAKARELCHLLGGYLPVAKHPVEFHHLMANMANTQIRIGAKRCSSRLRWLPIIQDVSEKVQRANSNNNFLPIAYNAYYFIDFSD